MGFSETIHFTDYVIGHSHLAMLGFATFASIAGLLHAWQKMTDAPYHAGAINAAYWLTTIGIVVMVSDLTLAGLAQGDLWKSGAPWVASLRASEPYWVIRTLSAIPVTAGFGLLCYGLLRAKRSRRKSTGRSQGNDQSSRTVSHRRKSSESA